MGGRGARDGQGKEKGLGTYHCVGTLDEPLLPLNFHFHFPLPHPIPLPHHPTSPSLTHTTQSSPTHTPRQRPPGDV